MFARQSKQGIVVRVLLIAVILFNALAPTAASARSLGENPVAGRDGNATLAIAPDPYVVESSDNLSDTPVSEPRAATKEDDNEVALPALLLSVDPDFLTPGGSFTLAWTIEGVVLEGGTQLSLQLTLPESFSLEGTYEGQFDPASHILTVPVASLKGQIHLKAGNSTNAVILQAVLFKDTEILAQASLPLAAHEQFVVERKGGEVRMKNSKVRVQFPSGILPEKTVVDIGQPSGDEAPPYSLSGRPFEIKAHGQQSRKNFNKFSQDITIFASYADLGIPEEVEDNLYLYWYNAETGEWIPLPTDVDQKTKTLEAVTDHFTVFDIDVNNWQASHLPTVDSFQVSTFTGAGTYSLPIVVPAGPGGFQPSLSLNYNSQVVDQSTTLTQASWVGMGWSLDTGSIERDSHGTNSTADDTYFLNVGGVSTRIVQDPDGAYHAADENFWKISRGPWVVKDKQGNTYSFEHVAQRVYCSEGEFVRQGYQWSLTRVKNIFGAEILYTYDDEGDQDQCDGELTSGEAAVYPETITYAGSKYRVRFATLRDRLDYQRSQATDLTFQTYQRRRLKNIYVEQDLNGDGTFETILRRYEFQYADDDDLDVIFPRFTWSAGGKTSTLRSVREYGVGGTTALPATTFTYGDNLHLTRAENGYGGAVEFDYELWYDTTGSRPSQKITHNFGDYGPEPCLTGSPNPWYAREGTVSCDDNKDLKISGSLGTATAVAIQNARTSTYQNYSKDMVRPGGVYKLTAWVGSAFNGLSIRVGLYDGVQDVWYKKKLDVRTYIVELPAEASKVQPLIQESGVNGNYAYVTKFIFQLLPSFWRVTQKRVYDGVHPVTDPYVFSYGYSSPAMNTSENSPNSECVVERCAEYFEWHSEFRGHGQVTETGSDGRQTITTFYQDDLLKGRPVETTILSGSQILSKTIYQYTAASLPVEQPTRIGCSNCTHAGILRTWVTTDAVENRIYPTPYVDENTYVATRQTSAYEANYGNLIAQTDQVWETGNWSTYRSTLTDYFPNTTGVYLVGLPARQQIKDAGGNVLAESLNLYDSNTTYNAPPSVGKLTAVRSWVDGALSTGRYSQVSYAYDSYGNQTAVTTYNGYGTALTAPTTGERTTTTVFDPVFHVYPISSTSAGLTTTWSYDFDNNGENDYILGLPIRETDPNLNITSARYDSFGRMTRLIRPGDNSTYPTVVIGYHDTNLFWTEIRQRIDNTRYLTIRRHYDGIGRQTSIESGSTVGGVFSLNNTVAYQYPAFNIVEQSMPYGAEETPAYTETVSDVLGRPMTVTAPNGNLTSYSYNGLTTIVTDGKGNNTTSTTDVWGRVVSVLPPTGPGVTYTYDVLNSLKTAARGGVMTEIFYDHAGRKTSMSDPDMGDWSYAYDALGNLTSQIDARGCQLSLNYDPLNRLLTKASSGTSCGAQINTSYGYDAGANGLGQRTSMSDASGSTSWDYDVRGRMTQEVKSITGTDPFTTAWTYNSADLPVSMTYPDSEVLTYHYNNTGQLDFVSSSTGGTYLANTEYDKAGRIKMMEYGAGVVQKTFSYFPWGTAVQGGLLDSATTTRLSDSAILQNFAYSYDANANVGTITDNLAGPQTQTFGYDALNRLTSAQVTGGTDGLYSETYQYDPNTGNLSQKGGLTYSYGDSAHTHAVTNAGTNAYAYDANGNMTQRIVDAQTFDLAYDAENRLTGVNLDSQQGHAPSGKFPSFAAPQPLLPHKALYAPAYQSGSTETPTATLTATPAQTATPTATLSPTETATSLPTNTATPRVDDSYTVSLLHMNGADGSTTFTDESDKIWTIHGDAQIDTAQSKFSGAAGVFDGAGDWIHTSDHTDFNVGNGDWTIDYWVRTTGTGIYTFGQSGVAATGENTGIYGAIIAGGKARISFCSGTTSYSATSLTSVNDGTWHHVAGLRYGSMMYIAVDGILEGAKNVGSATVNDTPKPFSIGAIGMYTSNRFSGSIDEFRFSKGVARWTANFTPPASEYVFSTAPTPTATPTAGVDDSYSISLLHMNGPDGSILFGDESGKSWTANGNAQVDSAQSKFGGAAVLFDGTDDWIFTLDHADFNVGSGDWTIDYWMKTTGSDTYMFGQSGIYPTGTNTALYGWVSTIGKAQIGFYKDDGTTAYSVTSLTSVNDGAWHHIAGIRYGSTMYIAVDGALEKAVNVSTVAVNDSPKRFSIGAIGEYDSKRFNGSLDEFRFSKGIARWTSHFTPPVSEYLPGAPVVTPTPGVDDNYTASLLHMWNVDQGTVFTDGSGKTWRARGNAQVDSAQSKFGGTAGWFDGTDDWIDTVDHADFNVGSGDWTVDYWVRTTSNSIYTFGQAADGTYPANGATTGLYGVITSTGKARIAFYSGTTAYYIDSITSVNNGEWHHVAGIRHGSTLYIAVDGALEEDLEVGTLAVNDSSSIFSVGALGACASSRFNGHIDEFRFSKGVARWTDDFDPPTSEYAYVEPTVTPTPVTPTVIPTTPIGTITTPEPVAFARMDFTYDGDGKRVKSVLNNGAVTTYFVGAHYEVEVRGAETHITKYYYAGTQRIAMRTGTTLLYLLSDHLGSASLTTDAAGNIVSELRYKAWGEVRYEWGATPTDYTYTGQYSYTADFGLMYYNARWYDPSLGRFNQPDTIVPEQSQGVQAWDRYAYTNNNPAKYTDPNGHFPIIPLIALVGLVIFTSQIPSDVPQADPANWGNPNVMAAGLMVTLAAPEIAYLGGQTLMGLGQLTNSPTTWAAGYSAYVAATTPAAEAVVAAGADEVGGYGEGALGSDQLLSYSRHMSIAELKEVQRTGYLRGDYPGDTYFTVDKYVTASQAQQRLSLSSPPEVRLDFIIKNSPTINGPQTVLPKYDQSGLGSELWSPDKIMVLIENVFKLFE